MKRNLRLLYAIALLQGMVFYGPIATLYRAAAGVGIFEITLIESLSLALCVALELPWGVVADKIGYRRTMIFCCALYFISKLVFWRAEGFGGFLLERLLLSVVMAGLSGVDASLLYLSCEKGESQRAFGLYNGCCTAGLLLASTAYTVLLAGQSYRLTALLTAIAYGLAALLSLGLTEVRSTEKSPGAGAFRAALKTQLSDKRLLCLLVGAALLSEASQTLTVFLSQLQYVRCGMSAALIGAAYGLVTAAGLLGAFSGRLTKRLGERRVCDGTFLLCAASCALLALTQSSLLSIAGVVCLRVGASLLAPLQTELQNRRVQSENRATLLSVNAVLMEGVAVATNLLYGKAADLSLPLALGLGCALCLTGWGLFRRGAADAPSPQALSGALPR
ncbi:MAG: MFS transporter [Eubacteriales bacterium]|nr:MFS transporter [Eubacteriales bacterium]